MIRMSGVMMADDRDRGGVKAAELRATALSFSLEIPSSRHRLQDLRRKTADSPTIYRTPAATRT